MKEESSFLVCTRCFTYNHSKFITDTMNGFCMQKTTFPFVCTIVDDASTDGEQETISKYLERNFNSNDKSVTRNEETDDYVLTFTQHKNNKNCFFAVIYLKYNHYSIKKDKLPYIAEWHETTKYIALCEGDDYWTDPLKLQKQVDFLEANPDYGMVYSGHRRYIQKENRFVIGKNVRQTFNDLLVSNKIATHTVLFRTSLHLNYEKEIRPIAIRHQWKMGDTPRWLYIMAQSKAKYMPEIMGVYRQLENSASHFTSYKKDCDFWISHYDMSLFFAKKYKAPVELQQKIVLDEIEFLIGMARSYKENLHLPFYRLLKDNGLFTAKRYISCKMRSTTWGRRLYFLL